MKSIEKYRDEFPITKNAIFLNHAGVSPVCGRAADAIRQWLDENDRGYSAMYELWHARVERVRKQAARFIGASPREIAFIRNTSHGLGLVAAAWEFKPGDNVISYDKEFPANHYPWRNLERKGVELRLVGDHDGRILLRDIAKKMDSRTRMIALSSVEFASGFRNDLEKLGKICSDAGILFAVDGIQSLGALDMDVKRNKISFLAADSHKWLLGPEGVGIFYARGDVLRKIKPPIVGWNSVKDPMTFLPYHFKLKDDASKFEEGSHNLAGIFALGACLSLIEEVGISRIEARIIELTDYLVKRLKALGFKVLSPRKSGEKSGIVMFAGIRDPLKKVAELKEKNIFISSRQGALRVSPHFYNTADEIDTLLESLR